MGRASQSKAGFFATLLAAAAGCAGIPDGASKGAFDGLKDKAKPSTEKIGVSASKETAVGFAQADEYGYMFGTPVLLNGNLTALGGEFARTQDGKFTQWGMGVSGAALYDVVNAQKPEGSTFADTVIALGPSAGFAFVKDGSFYKRRMQAEVGGRLLAIYGRVQADLQGRAIVDGDLEAKYGLDGDFSGYGGTAAFSFDAGQVLPANGRLAIVPRISMSKSDFDVDGRVQAQDVKLESKITNFTGGVTLAGDYDGWYAGVAGELGHIAVRNEPGKNDSLTSHAVRLLGGKKLSERVTVDGELFYSDNGAFEDYGASVGLRYNH